MSEIHRDIMKNAADALLAGGYTVRIGSAGHNAIYSAILAERERCAAVARSIMPHTTGELHLIETIVRRIRGEG